MLFRSEQLSSNVLLTFDGDGHTAYMRGSKCVDKYVEDYLIDGVIPSENVNCPAIVK